VLVISSHGREEPVFDSSLQGGSYMYLPKDSTVWRHAILGSDNELIFVDEILKIFDDQENKDSYLKGKPKLFFLQVNILLYKLDLQLYFLEGYCNLAYNYNICSNLTVIFLFNLVVVTNCNPCTSMPTDHGLYFLLFSPYLF
jgi:hypothetical protein